MEVVTWDAGLHWVHHYTEDRLTAHTTTQKRVWCPGREGRPKILGDAPAPDWPQWYHSWDLSFHDDRGRIREGSPYLWEGMKMKTWRASVVWMAKTNYMRPQGPHADPRRPCFSDFETETLDELVRLLRNAHDKGGVTLYGPQYNGGRGRFVDCT